MLNFEMRWIPASVMGPLMSGEREAVGREVELMIDSLASLSLASELKWNLRYADAQIVMSDCASFLDKVTNLRDGFD